MKISCFDAHCDTLSRCAAAGEELRKNAGAVDLERGKELGRYAQFFAMFHDAGKAPEDGMLAQCRRLHDFYRAEVQKNSDLVCHCRTGTEIDSAVSGGRIAALLSVEGADLLECDIGNLDMASDWGVRLMNPVWNRANVLSGSNKEEPDRGLSSAGRDFIRAMEDHQIYVDVSHISDTGFWDIMKITNCPVVASHSDSRAVWGHPRNLTDDMFRALRDTGGVAGINVYTDFIGAKGTMDELVAHIEHFLNLNGEKSICLGGDMDGCESLAGGIRGIEDVPRIYETLQKRGYPDDLLKDLLWNNLRRLF